jgi:hypothetical protein
VMSSRSHSTYHSLQSSLSKNSARAGLGFQASYTYSKSLDDTSSVLGGVLGGAGVVLQTLPQNPWDPGAEKGPSTFDATHSFTLSLIQVLPLDRISFLRPLGRTLTRGWQFLNITTLTSGPPFTVYSGVQQTGVGAGGTDRPDLVEQPKFSTSGPVREDYFGRGADNASFFSIPINVPGGTGPNHGRFGTLGRNTFRGPGFTDFDVALIKDTPFGRRGGAEFGTVEFRAEFFNVFNHSARQRFWHHQQDRGTFAADTVLIEADLLIEPGREAAQECSPGRKPWDHRETGEPCKGGKSCDTYLAEAHRKATRHGSGRVNGSFAPLGARSALDLRPTACAVGYILTPLGG